MPQTRRSMPKVRSGCITCKRRRIKCDEQTPKCLRCIRSDRECEGYLASNVDRQQTVVSKAIAVYNLPFKVPGSQADRQRLHFYCSQAAESLASYSDPTLWTSLVLQRSYHQPVIRNALLTLTVLYQDHLLDTSPPTSPTTKNLHLITKCHRQLTLHLDSPDASVEVALLCSLMFYAFESLVANPEQAIWHLDQGLVLLSRCQTEWPHLMTSSDGILTHLLAVFSRLDIQASTFDDSRAPKLRLVSSLEKSGLVPVVPECFINTSHAEGTLTKLQNWMMHHLIAHVDHKEQSLEELPQDILYERLILEEQFERFIMLLNTFLDNSTSDMKHLLVLRFQGRVFHSVLLENIPLPNIFPTAARAHRPTLNTNFHAALEDISNLLSLTNTDGTSERAFTLSTQIVSGLFFVCLKTTDSATVQAALSFLQDSKLPSRDGLWDAGIATSVIETILERKKSDNACIEQRVEDIGVDVFDPVEGGLNEVFKSLSVN